MILVTGAYGFIGSNFVKYLNTQGITDIVVVDYLTNGHQFKNLNNCKFKLYATPEMAIEMCSTGSITQVFHFGAVSATTCWDGELVMSRNYKYTVDLINACVANNIPISYSSSASVYGNGDGPLNLYAYSKLMVDKFVTALGSNLVQGFRYFNVYSLDDSEWHKGDQASPYYKFKQQALVTGEIQIFKRSENYYRDFVTVNRVCEVQWAMRKQPAGIYDLGSGSQKNFAQVAAEVKAAHGGKIKEIPFPKSLRDHYQVNTLADMSYLTDSPISI